MPVSKLRRLEKMIDRNSKFEDMGQGSRAIVPLCMWLIALVDYHYTKMAIQPYKDRLVEAEETLMEVFFVICSTRCSQESHSQTCMGSNN